MHVHERDRAGNRGTRADEHRTPLDLDPELLPARLGHDAIITDETVAAAEAPDGTLSRAPVVLRLGRDTAWFVCRPDASQRTGSRQRAAGNSASLKAWQLGPTGSGLVVGRGLIRLGLCLGDGDREA